MKPLLLAFGFLSESFGQAPDSVRRLEEVVIASTRIQVHSVGYRMELLDSFAIASSTPANLTELLTRNSNVHVRSYGPNGLSAPNLRGSGNSHTSILWNGINLQSPASGELDISLLPTSFIDDVTVQFGGAASLFGAGAIGGAIHLTNNPSYDKGLTLQLSQNYGSFNRHHQSYGLGWSNRNFSSSIKVFRYSADNDFRFNNITLSGSPEEKRRHSGAEQQGLLFQNYWKWNDQNQLSLRLWLQENDIEVPEPITVAGIGTAVQSDNFNRSLLTWEHLGNKFSSTAKSALVNHTTTFTGFPSTTYHSNVNEYEVNLQITPHLTFNTGINNTYEWVDSGNHGTSNPSRNRTAVFFSARQSIGTMTILNVRAREELIAGDLTPFIPSLGLEHYFNKSITLKSSISRNYLIPTFNQLYWSGAGGFGNLTLRPELSWSEEVGLVYHRNSNGNQWLVESELTGFSSQVDDWILWVPVTSSEWSPDNIKRVWSRGLESSLKIKRDWTVVSLSLHGNYGYTKATNQQVSETGNPSEIGNQLIYTPSHTGKINATLSIKSLKVGWWHHITGKQFTTGDNTEIQALESFGISSVVVSNQFWMGALRTSLQFEINNLFNKNYLVRTGYPMPLRNIRFGLTIKL